MKIKFKELTPQQKEYIRSIYILDITHSEKMDILSTKFGISPRTVRSWWKKLDLQKVDTKLPSQLKDARNREISSDADIILVTSCQNKTQINEDMLHNMKSYANYIEREFDKSVEIVIIPSRYRNPTSLVEANSTKEKAEQWWVDEVQPYLYYNKLYFGDTLIAADARINPTASNPLNGYEALASENHLLLPHPRIHTKTLPRFKGGALRLMTTTGFLSRKNYSDSKSGNLGYIHHSYGFIVVEKDSDTNECLPPRAVKVKDDGSFTDINKEVSGETVSKIDSVPAFVLGDIHHREIDTNFMAVTADLLKDINPDQVIMHDLLDASSFNHHEKDDLYIKKQKIKQGKHLIGDEINEAIQFADHFQKHFDTKVVVVQSNHDDFIEHLINRSDWKKDLHNSESFLELALIQQRQDLEPHGNIFGYLVNNSGNENVVYVKNSSSVNVMGYEVGQHGDYGANGARGNINSFARLNTKMIHGHSHSPQAKNGVTCVGVSCKLWQYYNSNGMSSWANAHSIIHPNGKNQLLIYNDSYELSQII